jgi:hypothetical protein
MPNWFSRRMSLRAPSVLNSDYRPGFVQAAASLCSGALRMKGAGRAGGVKREGRLSCRFDRYGLRLGLSIVRKMAQLLDHQITLRSSPGARF